LFFKKRGNTSEAMKTLTRAVELLPTDHKFRINIGDLYRDMGIAYRAEEEYRQALIISPGNQQALRRLKALEKISP
jgi:Flp pilus assembly protein TadD